MPTFETRTPFPPGGTEPHPRRRRLYDVPLIGPLLDRMVRRAARLSDLEARQLQHDDRLSTLERDMLIMAPDRDLAAKLLATLPVFFDKVRGLVGDSQAKDRQIADLQARNAELEGRATAAESAAATDAADDVAAWQPVDQLLTAFEQEILPAAEQAPEVVPVVDPVQVPPVLSGDVAPGDPANADASVDPVAENTDPAATGPVDTAPTETAPAEGATEAAPAEGTTTDQQ